MFCNNVSVICYMLVTGYMCSLDFGEIACNKYPVLLLIRLWFRYTCIAEMVYKTTVAPYSNKGLQHAITDVRDGQSMRGASAKRTMMRHCRGGVTISGRTSLYR